MEFLLKREKVLAKVLRRLIAVAAFVILITLGALIRIPLPFTPVPITLQTFFVLLSGALLGSAWGAVTQLAYICLGMSGLTVFTSTGAGLFYLFGPTGGYLFGFILASLFIGGLIKQAKNNFFLVLGLFCAGDVILLSSGVLWLKVILGGSLSKLLLIGFFPFVVGDLLKAVIAASIYLRLKSRWQK